MGFKHADVAKNILQNLLEVNLFFVIPVSTEHEAEMEIAHVTRIFQAGVFHRLTGHGP